MSEDTKDLIQKLVEAPYGKAKDILKKNGLWDERRVANDPDTAKRYRMRVYGEMPVSAAVTVEASSEEEAIEKAEDEEEAIEKAEDIANAQSFSWSGFDDVENVYAEVGEIL